MSNIEQTTGKRPRSILRMRFCLSVITLVMVGVLMGCVKYVANDPSQVGVFYPNECVTLRGREVNGSPSAKTILVTICQPVNISEVGIATYYDPENTGDHEVARLEFSNNSIYVWTVTLREVGRIEYSGNKTATSKFFMKFADFWHYVWVLAKLIAGLIVILVIISLFSGGGGGTWSGGGSTSTGGSWSGGGSFK